MHVLVQRKKLVKYHRVTVDEWQQAVATAPVKADSLLMNNCTLREGRRYLMSLQSALLLAEMLWLQKMMGNPLRINVGLKKKVGKNRIWTETLL